MSLTTLEQNEALWGTIQARHKQRELDRLKPPLVELWDGDYNLRGEVGEWRELEFKFVENDAGPASLKLSLSNYLARWVMDHKGRAKRNVHITIEKQGARWSGRMENYKVVREKGGDAYLEIIFIH